MLSVDVWRPRILPEQWVMPPQRKYIRDANRKLVDGLSIHKPSGRHYSIDDDGKRRYWGTDRPEAIRRFRAHAEGIVWLKDSAVSLPEQPVSIAIISGPKHKPKPKPETKGSKQRLSDCFAEWWKIMLNFSDQPTTYMKDVKRAFHRFVVVVGNKQISKINADDFAAWRSWVTREKAKRGWSAKAHNDQHKYVKNVFSTVKSERPSWPFPDGLLEWQHLPKAIRRRNKYVSKKHNREPMPVDVFHAVLAQAERWTQGPTEFETATNSGKGKKRGSNGRLHRGITAAAMFRLAANCGLDNADTAAATWDNIKNLDGSLPYLDMPRVKIKNQSSVELDRKIPLLPSTVKALQRLRDECRISDTLFRTEHGSPHNKNSIYDQLEDTMIEAGLDPRFPDGVNGNTYRYVRTKKAKQPDGTIKRKTIRKLDGEYKRKQQDGWTFKHLRNIGGKRRHGIGKEERDHFLGHVDQTQTRWYTGDADQTYLVALVNGMGAEYFDGETVARLNR